jgi:arylsulfatase A-like enzyme
VTWSVRIALALAGAALASACGHRSGDRGPTVEAGQTEPSTGSTPDEEDVAFDAISGFDACVLAYGGPVVDLGDTTARSRFGGKLEAPAVDTVERDGAKWARAHAHSLSLGYYTSPADLDPPAGTEIDTRVRGVAAKTMAIYLDGRLVGRSPLAKEAGTVTLKGPGLLPGEGEHEILLRFSGAPRGTSEALAEIEWLHVGAGDPDPHYAAPTRADTLVSANLGGQPMQALSLRAPGFARCSGWIPAGATVEATIGVDGAPEGSAAIRILRDRAAPVVLGNASVLEAAAKPVSWSVGDVGSDRGVLGAIDFVATRVPKGGRILFGHPRIVSSMHKKASQGASTQSVSRGVVLVVIGGLATHSLAVYGGTRAVPELAAVAQGGTVFDAHRATSGLSSGAFASMITGQTARMHTLEDADARLPRSLTTIADAARQAGIATALFTANPMTGSAFGFDRGWGTFQAQDPSSDQLATIVFDQASHWIEEHKTERFLLVVYARGGHPPWDATPEQLKTLEPQGYTGGLDAKHAAELLGRAHRATAGIHWTDADRARAWALYGLAVDAHDAALGRFVQALRAAGRENDTALIVTGDVAVNEAAHIPFAEADALDEASLSVPLVVRLPAGAPAGVRVSTATSGLDVARTVLDALGLEPPSSFGGVDLVVVARGSAPDPGPMLATAEGHFALRWNRYVLSGARGKETKLCDLSLEPACITDVRATYPIALDILHRVAFDALVDAPSPPPREPATLFTETASALRAWGR